MSKSLKYFVFFILIFLIHSLAYASELVLKDGRVVDGKIIEQTPKYIRLDIDGGLGIMTYYFDEIDTVDGQKFAPPSPSTAVIGPVAQTNSKVETSLNNEVQSQPVTGGGLSPSVQNFTNNSVDNTMALNVSSAVKDKALQGAQVNEEVPNTSASIEQLVPSVPLSIGSLYHSDNVGVTINVPKGWSVEERANKSDEILNILSPQDFTPIGIMRSKLNYNKPDGVLDQNEINLYRTTVSSYYWTQGRSVDFKNERTMNLKGLTVYAVDYSLTPSYKEGSGGCIYMFYKGGYEFYITTLYTDMTGELSAILDSISVDTSGLKKESFNDFESSVHIWMGIILGSIYFFLLFCTYCIARKLNIGPAWWAWVPFTHPFLICRILKANYWWVLGIFISLTYLGLSSAATFFLMLLMFFVIFPIFVSYKIIKILKKPDWLIVWACVPLINYIIWGYLAFCEE